MSDHLKTEDRLLSSEDQSVTQPTTSDRKPTTTEPEELWESTASSTSKAPAEEEGRIEKLKRYRKEMAHSITIPDMWGKESLLKDWTGFPSAVERSLLPEGLSSARQALVVACRQAE